ncbi:MAG: DegV family protein [Candidatus Neomarinimicrobiota bacterium]
MKIIVDSTCQIEPQVIKDLDLGFIDYPLYLNGEEYITQWDSPTILEDKKKFIELIRDKNSKASTSGITEREFIRVFQHYKDEEVLFIVQSLNNTKATGHSLKKVLKEHPEFNVKVFDTQILASGVGVQALALLRELREKDLSRDEAFDLLVKNRSNTWVVGLLYDLFYLHRSGRVDYLKAVLASAMRIFPILSSVPESGMLKSTGKVRNFKQANSRFLSAIKEEMIKRESKKLTVNMAYSNEHNKECLHMEQALEKAAEDFGWKIEVHIHFTNFSLIPHMGPDFYEMGYVIHT